MTAEPVGAWDEGRDALRRHDWQSAYDALSSAGAATAADPEALQDLAEAAWWLGKLDECIAARELAYEAYEAAGDAPRAVRVAARLFDDHCFKGRPAIAHAWVQRAAKTLGDDLSAHLVYGAVASATFAALTRTRS